MKILAGKAGKRLWMSEYASGDFPVTDISTGLKLSIQASTPSGSQPQAFMIVFDICNMRYCTQISC